jgi:AcrR family transcriptional regulator
MTTQSNETAADTPRTPRPRDSTATKQLLLSAATAEFAEYGLAGARIDRIAERAGANKRLLYVYYGDKDKLFEAVLHHQIGRLAEETPLIDGDLVGYAAARFDYLLAHPDAARLAAWRRFELNDRLSAKEVESYSVKVEAVAAAQREGRLDQALPAADLFAIVLRMTESWLDAPAALRLTAQEEPMSPERLATHRAALLEAVRRITVLQQPQKQ